MNENGGSYERIAAVLWMSVLVAWSASSILSLSRDWDGAPAGMYMLGALFLLAAGVLTMMRLVGLTKENRSATTTVGLVVGGFAVAASFIAWAVPLWAAIYAVAMGLVAMGSRQVRRTASIIGAGMITSLIFQFGLTALKVGNPDEYGDYPIAWTSAWIVALLAGALGMWQLSRQVDVEEKPERLPVSV